MAILSEVEEDQTPTNPSPSSETVKPENKEEEAAAAAAADEKKTDGKRGTFILSLCVCGSINIYFIYCFFVYFLFIC